MKGFFNTVQKRVGLLISIIGLAVILSNILHVVHNMGYEVLQAMNRPTVWLLFVTLLPFFISVFVECKVLKILQVVVFFFTGVVNLLGGGYEEFYGPAMFLAGWLLMRQYGFLERYPRAKTISVMALIVIISQISAIMHQTGEGVYAGFSTLAFFLFLIILILIIWWDMLAQQQLLKEENLDLKMNYGKLSEKIEELEEKQESYDLKAAGITPAQRRVIEVLTVYKASNREIAERLNISESTVKLHLYNIYNKLGVDNRFTVIDLCKYNFME